MSQKLNLLLEKELTSGEKVLWSGQPGLESLLLRSLLYLVTALAATAGCIYLLVAYIFNATPNAWASFDFQDQVEFVWCLIGLLFVACFMVGLLYFTLHRHSHTVYAVTNQRVLILIANKDGGKHLLSTYSLGELEDVRCQKYSNQTGDLSFYYKGVWYRGFERVPVAEQIENLILKIVEKCFV